MTNNKTLTELEQAAETYVIETIHDDDHAIYNSFIAGHNNAINSQNLVKMEDVVKVIEEQIKNCESELEKPLLATSFILKNSYAKEELTNILTQLKNLK